MQYLDKNFLLLTITRKSAENFARIKHGLKKRGRMVPDSDISNACIAMDAKAKLMTGDRHSRDIDGLEVVMV